MGSRTKEFYNTMQFDTKYYYEVGNGNTTRKFWFRTPPSVGPDVPYTFGLIGNLISHKWFSCLLNVDFQLRDCSSCGIEE